VVKVIIKKSFDAKKAATVEFMIDSGAVYSVSIRRFFGSSGARRTVARRCFLADGTAVERAIGGAAPVIFGQEGDSNLLGATTLRALDLDPFKRELRPMTTALMGASPFG